MPRIITPKDRSDWLAMRRLDVTSTESAALFGLSPYLTAFELYQRKVGALTDEIEQSGRMTWGLRLQDAIALGVAQDLGLRVRRINSYWRHDDEATRMGSSFDFEIIDHPSGPGLMEIKNVDFIVYRDEWLADEAPPHIEVQVQHQLEVANRDWALIVAMVGGNTVKTIRVERDRAMGAQITAAIRAFWQRVDAKTPPAPDYAKDAETIRALFKDGSGAPLNAKGNNYLQALVGAYDKAREDEKDAAARKKAAQAEILTMIGNAEKVLGDGWSISAKTINKGEYVVKPTSYRDFRLTMKSTAAA